MRAIFVVTNYTLLTDPQELLGRQWSQAPSPERLRTDLANILIAGNYHCVAYDRATRSLLLPRSHDLEYYLAGLKKDKPPLAVASFVHLDEAEAWWRSQPSSARWAWLSVAGEFYLAAYYPHIGRRALYPLSMAESYEVEPG